LREKRRAERAKRRAFTSTLSRSIFRAKCRLVKIVPRGTILVLVATLRCDLQLKRSGRNVERRTMSREALIFDRIPTIEATSLVKPDAKSRREERAR